MVPLSVFSGQKERVLGVSSRHSFSRPSLYRQHFSSGRLSQQVDRLVLAVVFVLAMSLAPALASELRLTHPNEAMSGSLLVETDEPGQFVQAPTIASDVEINVSGPFVRTRVTQRFVNSSSHWVEGIYVFPLPDGGAVDTLKMQIGERFIEGKIEERQKAKRQYEAAKAEGKKTALLEQERPNIFTNSIANIGPNEEIIVQIEYQETARLSDGVFSLRFPMVVAPRYNPAPVVKRVQLASNEGGWALSDPVPDRGRIEPEYLNPANHEPRHPVQLSVDLEPGFEIGEISTGVHLVIIDRDTKKTASLTLATGSVPANQDFELTWRPAKGVGPSAGLFTEMIDGTPYYLAMVMPPHLKETQASRLAREAIFVIDTSGSMAGTSIRQARASLLHALTRLTPADRFNIIQFNSDFDMLFDDAVMATPANLAVAASYVEALEAQGGTEMLSALNAALQDQSPDDRTVRQVIFLTDGAIGNEAQLFKTIATNRARSRIFTVGIGSAPNSFFMSRAAEVGQGTFTHIGAVDQVEARMTVLFDKLESPVVTDLSVAWPDGTKVEGWPSPLPDIYAGEPLVIAARIDETVPQAGNLVEFAGRFGNQPWKVRLSLEEASDRPGVSKIWARRKIASLELDRARRNSADGEIDREILSTALAHGLVSRLTSLIAVDATPSRPSDASLSTRNVPLNLPAGWDFASVFGEEIQHSYLDEAALDARLARVETLKSDAVQGGPTSEKDRIEMKFTGPGIPLPQTAALWQLKLISGLMLLIIVLVFSGKFSFSRGVKVNSPLAVLSAALSADNSHRSSKAYK